MHDEPGQDHLPPRTGEVEEAGLLGQDYAAKGVARPVWGLPASERPGLANPGLGSPGWARRVAEPGTPETAPDLGQGVQPRSVPNLDVILYCCQRYPLSLATRPLGAGLAQLGDPGELWIVRLFGPLRDHRIELCLVRIVEGLTPSAYDPWPYLTDGQPA